jgi:hypothetical protein
MPERCLVRVGGLELNELGGFAVGVSSFVLDGTMVLEL